MSIFNKKKAKSGERYEYVKDDELAKLLKQKEELIKKNLEYNKKVEELRAKQAKIAEEVTPIKEQIIKMASEHAKKFTISEFEDVLQVELMNGDCMFTIADAVEDFKRKFAQAKIDMAKKRDEESEPVKPEEDKSNEQRKTESGS